MCASHNSSVLLTRLCVPEVAAAAPDVGATFLADVGLFDSSD